MPVTQEPKGLTWINNVNMTSFGPIISQVCWLAGSLMATVADYQLLLASDAAVRESGIVVLGMLLGAWTGKTIVGAVDAHNKRKVYAEEKVKTAAIEATTEHPIPEASAP